MTPRTASLPVGPCRQGYRKERMEADSPRPRLPRCATNEKIVRYQHPIPTRDRPASARTLPGCGHEAFPN